MCSRCIGMDAGVEAGVQLAGDTLSCTCVTHCYKATGRVHVLCYNANCLQALPHQW
jgi:hypothetical protein